MDSLFFKNLQFEKSAQHYICGSSFKYLVLRAFFWDNKEKMGQWGEIQAISKRVPVNCESPTKRTTCFRARGEKKAWDGEQARRMTQLSMYSIEIDLNSDKKKETPFSCSSNPEKLISTLNETSSETLNATWSARPIAPPLTWSDSRPHAAMASGTRIWPPVLPCRSPLGLANDCETCAPRRSPWICCESRAPTSPWNGSWNGTYVLPNETGTGTCRSESATWICEK